jgi:MFS family permease
VRLETQVWAPARDRQQRWAWATVAILIVLATLSYMDRAIISLLVEPIRRTLHLGDFQIGLLQGLAYALFFALCGVLMGYLVDHYPRRLIICLGVSIWSVAAACTGLASTFGQLFAARMAVGIGEATLSPAAFSIIADLFPRHRVGLASSIYSVGTVLGTAVAISVGGSVIALLPAAQDIQLPWAGAVSHPWQLAFIVTGLPGLLLAPLIFATPEAARRRPGPAGQANRRELLSLLSTRKVYLTCHFVGFSVITLMSAGLTAWLPAYLQRRFGLRIGELSLMIGAVTAGAGIPGCLFAGWIVDRGFSRGQKDSHLRYGALAAGGVGLFGVLAVATPQYAVTMACYAVVLFFAPVVGAAVAHLQITTPSHANGRIVALYLLVFTLLGYGCGPAIVGFLTQFVFRDPQRLGSALAITFVVFTPLSAGLLQLGRRAAVAAASNAGVDP